MTREDFLLQLYHAFGQNVKYFYNVQRQASFHNIGAISFDNVPVFTKGYFVTFLTTFKCRLSTFEFSYYFIIFIIFSFYVFLYYETIISYFFYYCITFYYCMKLLVRTLLLLPFTKTDFTNISYEPSVPILS